jgi:1-acyl-sn-glycerol-3-phosphate acyltransferase
VTGGPLLVRRLLVAPLVWLFEAAVVAASPLLAFLAALASPLAVGSRLLRVVAIAVDYAARHLACTLACGALWVASGFGRDLASARMRRAHYAVVRWFVAGLYRTMTRMTRVDVDRTEDSADAEHALSAKRGPLLVFSRHAGEGDSLLVLHELLVRHRRRPRVVLHEALRLEPLIDIIGHRLPNRFVDPRGGDIEDEIAAMARDLGHEDALLIFPEGGNFSPSRRRRAIERLRRGGHCEEAAWADEMRNVTAPRPGGALAAIQAAPDADVIFIGHAGVPVGIRGLWRSMANGERVQMRLWMECADAIPSDRDAQIDWLFGWWRTIDGWIDERRAV